MSLRTHYESMPSDEIMRRSAELLVHTSTSLYTPPPCYDFVFTPIFTAIFTNIGLSAGAVSFATSAATFIATTALTIGLQLMNTPKPPKPEAAKVPLAQPIPYRTWCVGRTRQAGAYMLWESKGPTLFAVQAVAGHRVKSFNRYWLHDGEVTIRAGGWVNSPGGGRYANNGEQSVKIETRLGLPTETAYTDPVTAFTAEGLWTADHRGDGQASMFMLASATRQKDQAKCFPYGIPQLSAEVDGAACWDFRDPAQSPDDPTTWQWTRNSAIICAWHLCFNEFGFGLDYRKALLPVLDLWKEEADICDEDVALAGGGTEKRYQCNGSDTTENGPKSGLNAILATCDGHLVSRGDGARILTVGKFRESRCAVLTDRDIVGHQIQYDVLFEDECNRFVPKFTYPATDYSTSDTDYFEDIDAQLLAGRPLVEEGEYGWCHQWRQARRLGIRDWRRLRQKVRGSLDVRLSGINAVYARWVRLETPNRLPRLDGNLIENRRSILALTKGAFTMDMIQHPDNIDDWSPAVDEGAQPPVPPAPGASGIPTPVINLVQAKPKNGSVYIRVVIIDPENASLTPRVRYRVADIDGLGTEGAWVEQAFPDADPSGGYINLNTNVVPSDELLEVEVAFTTAGGALGDWSPTEEVVSTVDPTPPAALASFTLTGSAPRLGNAAFAFAIGNDAHVTAVRIYRVATGGAFDPDTATLAGTLAVGPSASYALTDGDATRTNIITNGAFATDLSGWTPGTGWAWNSGAAKKTAGTASALSQNVGQANGDIIRFSFDVASRTAGQVTPGLTGTPNVNGAAKTANSTYRERLTANATGSLRFVTDTTFDGAIDNVIALKETGACAPQGVWDYYALPLNGSGVEGPSSGPLTVTII